MLRHKEKDDEAGGEGLGRLQTRKRLWRDSTGAVVAKRRPEHEKKKNNPSSSPKVPRIPRESIDSGSHFSPQDNGPLSPPRSLRDHAPVEIGETDHSQIPHVPTSAEDMWPMPTATEDGGIEVQTVPIESFDFLCNASWGSEAQDNTTSNILYNDLFAPDTGMSVVGSRKSRARLTIHSKFFQHAFYHNKLL
jgi:hypothetical protein